MAQAQGMPQFSKMSSPQYGGCPKCVNTALHLCSGCFSWFSMPIGSLALSISGEILYVLA